MKSVMKSGCSSSTKSEAACRDATQWPTSTRTEVRESSHKGRTQRVEGAPSATGVNLWKRGKEQVANLRKRTVYGGLRGRMEWTKSIT